MTVETSVQVRWGDMDAMGHVNNAVYLAYFETAREPWFEAAGIDEDTTPFVLRRIEIDYRSQLTFADGAVRVVVSLAGVGTSSLTTAEQMFAVSDGRLVAEARAVAVCLDGAGTGSRPIPDELRERLAAAV